MSPRLTSNPHAWLAVLLLALWSTAATAQDSATASPPAAPAAPSAAMTQEAAAAYRSAMEAYQPYTDEKTVNWKESNDNAGRIGGWRAYAKEASQPESGATPAADAATSPDPHAGHAKP